MLLEKLHTLDPVPSTHDSISDYKRAAEISDLSRQGYEVTVAERADSAYDRPDEIRRIYDYLRKGSQLLTAHEQEIRQRRRGLLALGALLPGGARKRSRQLDEQLSGHRHDILYGPDQTNAWPWHRQRGRATALLTIAEAHELQTTDDSRSGKYETMSGPLDASLFDFVFNDDVASIGGMPLEEAMIWAELEHTRKGPERAERGVTKRLQETAEFIKAPVTPEFKGVVQYCYDSLGIRERAHEVGQRIGTHVDELVENGRDVEGIVVMSIGCGTALPILQVMQSIEQKHDKSPKIILLDQDPLALAVAAKLAKDMGLEDSIEIHCKRLFSEWGQPVSLEDILDGRQLDVGEDSGLREYLPDALYKSLTKETWKRLRQGGLMTSGNMNNHRPQAEFLHGLMGWMPRVKMRSIRDGFRLHEESGVPHQNTTARVTASGVYTLFFSKK